MAEVEEGAEEWVIVEMPVLDSTSSNSISVLVAGVTRTGKSTLVNALLGKKVAREGGTLDTETSFEAVSFTGKVQGIDVTVWDSPGLQDGTENEDKYLEDIKNKCNGKIDLLLYCISFNTTRFMSGSSDMESMNKLTKTLSPEIWENAMIILTFANSEIRSMKKMLADPESVEPKFNERIEEWKSKIVQYFKDVGLSAEVAQEMQVKPAGRVELPGLFKNHRPWLSPIVEDMKKRAQPKMNTDGLIKSSDVKKEVSQSKNDKTIELVNPEQADVEEDK